MLDTDLARLYGVAAKALNQAVKRNRKRFPSDFMFRLNKKEAGFPRSQNVTLDGPGRGRHTKYCPYAFTEHGVVMLSSILNGERAIQVNIQIMRVFSKIRNMMETHAKLKKKIEEMERKYDSQFKIVFDAIRQLLSPAHPVTLPFWLAFVPVLGFSVLHKSKVARPSPDLSGRWANLGLDVIAKRGDVPSGSHRPQARTAISWPVRTLADLGRKRKILKK